MPEALGVREGVQETGLTGQVAFVTGGATGIGLAIARALALRGATVAIFNRNQERAHTAVSSLVGQGLKACGFEADVSRTESVESAFQRALESLGRVDVLVENAGL